MATAARNNSGNYDTVWTNTTEAWENDPENSFEDLVFLQTPALAIFRSQADVKPLGFSTTVRINEHRGTGVAAYEYYDNVSTAPQKGSQAASFKYAQYSAPIALSDQEAKELDTAEKLADHVDFVMRLQAEELGQLLAEDMFFGNSSDSKKILGLEQMLPAFTHNKTDGTASTAITDVLNLRFQSKQANNTYGGITRKAWTSNAVPGTYWEGNSVDLFQANIAYSSGAPNDCLQRLMDARALATYGLDKPNVMFSSYAPYRDYKVAAMSNQQIRSGDEMLDAHLTFENVIFDGMTWFWDDFCIASGDTASVADEPNIYMLNTRKAKMVIDSRQNMTMSSKREPVDQMASVRHLTWRGQCLSLSNRSSVRLFGYKAS